MWIALVDYGSDSGFGSYMMKFSKYGATKVERNKEFFI